MSFGLGRGRTLDPGGIGLTLDDLPPLPDTPPSGGECVFTRSTRADPRTWFPEPERPFEIEIGPGKGTFLVEEAARRPAVNFLGIEWAREFYLYTADRCRRRGLDNVRVLHADAAEFLHWRTPDAIAASIHLYFSDPWPKPRHHKRRVVQDRFLADAHRVLTPGGELRIVTDHEGYWQWMEERFARWTAPDGVDCAGAGRLRFDREAFDAAREGELVGTNFERKYAREGRPFHAAVLRKPLDGSSKR